MSDEPFAGDPPVSPHAEWRGLLFLLLAAVGGGVLALGLSGCWQAAHEREALEFAFTYRLADGSAELWYPQPPVADPRTASILAGGGMLLAGLLLRTRVFSWKVLSAGTLTIAVLAFLPTWIEYRSRTAGRVRFELPKTWNDLDAQIFDERMQADVFARTNCEVWYLQRSYATLDLSLRFRSHLTPPACLRASRSLHKRIKALLALQAEAWGLKDGGIEREVVRTGGPP
ncbi:MAG: hypothetical protein KIS92_08770 [Planctomycetota bacterium]|nr:hypothetical protein [Planctomycetota bacterium]